MVMLQWLWPGATDGNVSPRVIYYTLRVVMFILSFVLEDWAIHELVHSPRYRRQAVVLVASSYVTWTYQTHTFSNSIETLIVMWSLVLIERITHEKVRTKREKVSLPAHMFIEAIIYRLQLRSRILTCVWNFQSNYFPSFRPDTRPTFTATLLE
jgi:GPI mannosyltransferase 4